MALAPAAALPVAGAPAAAAEPAQCPVLAPLDSAGIDEVLAGDRWVRHLREDLLPYWTTSAALGDPLGNFPTVRDRSGTVVTSPQRTVRALARQVFGYVVAYTMTGEPEHLVRARAGLDWLLTHAKDREHGGYYGALLADGTPVAPTTTPKGAADLAFVGMAFGAYLAATRDPAAEAEVLEIRDLLASPARYWDAGSQRVHDALSPDLRTPLDPDSDGGDLTALLDPGNAFLLLVQPVLTSPARRAQVLNDLRRIARAVERDHVLGDPVVWGRTGRVGTFTSTHTDVGHTLKTYWFLHNVDRLLPEHPYTHLLAATRDALDRFWDAQYGRWAQRLLDPSTPDWGGAFWMHAEADQLMATLGLLDERYAERLATSARTFTDLLVDTEEGQRREMPFRIARAGCGQRPSTWTSPQKSGPAKSMYHVTEHALVLYLHGRAREGRPAVLHHAVPADQVDCFPAAPYLFHGDVVSRTSREEIVVGGTSLRHVEVAFDALR